MSKSEQFLILRKLKLDSGVSKAVLRCIHDHAGDGTCWASLRTLADESCFNRRTVIRAIADLETKSIIELSRKDGSTTHYRINWPVVRTLTSDRESPVTESHPCQKVTALVTESHLTSDRESPKTNRKQTGNKKRARTQFVPPSLEAVRAYCDSRSSSVDPQKFWDYFTAGDWKDSNGKAVANWKQKLLTWENNQSERKTGDKPDTRKYRKVTV